MVKKNKIVCIDEDLHEKVSQTNASKLINNLLGEYFGAETSENTSVIRSEIKKLCEKRAILSKKIKFFKEKLIKIQEKKDLEQQKNMDEKQKLTRKLQVEEHKRRYYAGEINEEEYMRFFDD